MGIKLSVPLPIQTFTVVSELLDIYISKSKAIPVTGRGGP
jgi:hypothetical protein